jgi:hypothetical protein
MLLSFYPSNDNRRRRCLQIHHDRVVHTIREWFFHQVLFIIPPGLNLRRLDSLVVAEAGFWIECAMIGNLTK